MIAQSLLLYLSIWLLLLLLLNISYFTFACSTYLNSYEYIYSPLAVNSMRQTHTLQCSQSVRLFRPYRGCDRFYSRITETWWKHCGSVAFRLFDLFSYGDAMNEWHRPLTKWNSFESTNIWHMWRTSIKTVNTHSNTQSHDVHWPL